MDARVRLQEAFKFALAVTLAYWLALSLDWDLPKYAALAVVLVSLDTTAATLNKGLARIAGTVLGVGVAWLLLAWFPQDRWAFMVAMSTHLALCGWCMQRSSFPYAWFVAGIVAVIVWKSSYGNVGNAFHFGVFRFLETAAGVTIATLVSALLWPRRAGGSPAPDRTAPPFPDWQRLHRAALPGVSFAAGFLLWVLTDPQGGTSVPEFAGLFGIMALLVPSRKAVVATAAALLKGMVCIAPVYFIVLPRLGEGTEVLAVIFAFSALFGWLGVKRPMLRVGAMSMFVLVTNFTNQQTYSLFAFVNTATGVLIGVGVMLLTFELLDPPPAAPSRGPAEGGGPSPSPSAAP